MCQYLFLTHFQKIIYNESVTKQTKILFIYRLLQYEEVKQENAKEYSTWNDVHGVCKYRKTFFNFLMRQFWSGEDLTQETFYQAYKSAHRYNGNCKISVWLCQIAKHLYFDYLKKEKHKTTVGIEHLESFEAVNNQRNLEDTYLIKEETKKLLSALRQVKHPYGQVFWLRAYEEMSFKEIGEIFDKSENWALR